MKRTELLQEIKKLRFEEAYGGWEAGRLTQVEAASLLAVCERTFRRYLSRYEEGGMAVVDFNPAVKGSAWPAGRMRTMTLRSPRHHHIVLLQSDGGGSRNRGSGLRETCPARTVGKKLLERVDASGKHTQLQPAASDVAE